MTEASVTPTIVYRDPLAAMRWLETAFGFETSLLLTDDAGRLAHAEMAFRGVRLGIAGEWEGPQLGGAKARSPATVGAMTQFLWLDLEGLDGHCDAARAAGARITQEPEDQFYGARTYRAIDPEGHVWCFRQHLRDVPLEDMTKAAGLKVAASLEAAS